MKSNVRETLEIMAGVYEDATIKCSADVSDLRDIQTLVSRVEKEGMSFLTITLPAFCKEFDRALDRGFVDSTSFPGFRKFGAIPAFLQGMLSRIFDRETGRLLSYEDSPDGSSVAVHTLVESVRQICLTFKKVELGCTPERNAQAIENFKQVEHITSLFSLPDEERARFRAVSYMLWAGMLWDFNPAALLPKHGPGATAERILGNQKYVWRNWFERLEPFFPFIGTALPLGVTEQMEEIESVSFVPEHEEYPVRVVLVPKTLKSPRIIAIEPVCMQYAQQAVRDYLYDRLERWIYSAGSVNFTDQSINQRIALMSSSSGLFSTIDLSDASDRVPLELVKDMFEYNRDFLDSILACRSDAAQLPDGTVMSPLAKFASMGSALCFPIEAMYFFTIMVIASLEADNLPMTYESLYQVTRGLYVYGDDIIVPSTNAEKVLEKLQLYNCKPNAAKTFLNGKFRESCGVDAYDGYEVTPVYLTHELPKDRRQSSAIASAVALSNAFYKKGYWRTAQLIRDKINSIVGDLPYVREDSEGLGYHSFEGWSSIERWNYDLHRFEVRTVVLESKRRTDAIDGYSGLAKSLLYLESLKGTSGEGAQLESSVLRDAVTLKRRWVAT